MANSTVRVTLVAVLATVAVFVAGRETRAQRAGQTAVEVSDSRIDAVVALAQVEKFALGFEYAGPELFESLPISDRQREPALEALLPVSRGFRVTRDRGVVTISHRSVPASARNVLNTRLQSISTPRRMHIGDVSLLLWMSLYRQLVPTAGGIAGSRLGAVVEDTTRYVGPLKLDNVTVREALNTIVREHGQAAWIVTVMPNQLDNRVALGQQRWIVAEFDEPRTTSFGQAVQAKLSRF